MKNLLKNLLKNKLKKMLEKLLEEKYIKLKIDLYISEDQDFLKKESKPCSSRNSDRKTFFRKNKRKDKYYMYKMQDYIMFENYL